MANTLIFLLATEKTGGLFDIDGSLPLMALQFLSLMFLLNFILYNPLLNIINDRNQYISKNLTEALSLLSESNQVLQQQEKIIAKARKDGQQEIANFQKDEESSLEVREKFHKELLTKLSKILNNDHQVQRVYALFLLEKEVNSLSDKIVSKILA